MSTVPWLDMVAVLSLALVAAGITIREFAGIPLDEAVLYEPSAQPYPWWGVPPDVQKYWLGTLAGRLNQTVDSIASEKP